MADPICVGFEEVSRNSSNQEKNTNFERKAADRAFWSYLLLLKRLNVLASQSHLYRLCQFYPLRLSLKKKLYVLYLLYICLVQIYLGLLKLYCSFLSAYVGWLCCNKRLYGTSYIVFFLYYVCAHFTKFLYDELIRLTRLTRKLTKTLLDSIHHLQNENKICKQDRKICRKYFNLMFLNKSNQ